MKKLSLNKKIVSNLNGQDMMDVKGGMSWTDYIWATIVYTAEQIKHWAETDTRCLSDDCTKSGCVTNDENQYTCNLCFGD